MSPGTIFPIPITPIKPLFTTHSTPSILNIYGVFLIADTSYVYLAQYHVYTTCELFKV